MTQFELMVTAISIVVGLGVTQILAAFVGLIRSRRLSQLDWMPMVWAFLIFVSHVQLFFGMYGRDQARPLTAPDFVVLVLMAVLLFLAGGLILPGIHRSEEATTLTGDCDRDGYLGLLPRSLASGIGGILNAQTQGEQVPGGDPEGRS